MTASLPDTPHRLRRMLAGRLGAAGALIGMLAGPGAASYLVDAKRTESAGESRKDTTGE